MAMDEDEDDDEDDGEIKQETRGRRRSNSFTSGQTQEGGAKKQAQDGDHSDVHKCLDCGKVYKHPNCLWKHRWLHSQYWKVLFFYFLRDLLMGCMSSMDIRNCQCGGKNNTERQIIPS